jgi:hypothetical protein
MSNSDNKEKRFKPKNKPYKKTRFQKEKFEKRPVQAVKVEESNLVVEDYLDYEDEYDV